MRAGARAGALTGADAGLLSCPVCGLLSRAAGLGEPGRCPRCGEELAFRRPESIQRTLALLVAALICYLPANLLPVMTTTTLTSVEDDTIVSGAVALYTSGSWHLAVIVLIASVVIPLAKMTALAYLLVAIRRAPSGSSRDRLRLYRLVGAIGRWSMLDVFVAAFVVALVRLEPLVSVNPGPGVVFFAAVVILTIFAAESFDTRLIWDPVPGARGPHDRRR